MKSNGNLNHWKYALAMGLSVEDHAAAVLQQALGFTIVRLNAQNARAVDMKGEVLVDIKALTSPYPSSPTPSKLSAAEHITLDYANIVKYADDTLLLCIVDYTQHEKKPQPTKGIFFITAGMVKQIIEEHPERIYLRSGRSFQDKSKKVGISIMEMGTISLPGLTLSQSVDQFKTKA